MGTISGDGTFVCLYSMCMNIDHTSWFYACFQTLHRIPCDLERCVQKASTKKEGSHHNIHRISSQSLDIYTKYEQYIVYIYFGTLTFIVITIL